LGKKSSLLSQPLKIRAEGLKFVLTEKVREYQRNNSEITGPAGRKSQGGSRAEGLLDRLFGERRERRGREKEGNEEGPCSVGKKYGDVRGRGETELETQRVKGVAARSGEQGKGGERGVVRKNLDIAIQA